MSTFSMMSITNVGRSTPESTTRRRQMACGK